MPRTQKFLLLLVATFGAFLSTQAFAGRDLDAVKARDQLLCGTANAGIAGFMLQDSQGKWTGFDVDVCRAVAAAILGDSEKVKQVPLSGQQRFTALQAGEVDMLSNNTTWTLSRDTQLGLDFGAVTYYDGQGFMVAKKLGMTDAKTMNGATVCVPSGSTTELNLADFGRANKLTLKTVVSDDMDQLRSAFFGGRCDVYTGDSSRLYSVRSTNVPAPGTPEDYVILAERISKEPLAPVFRHGDNQFGDVVRWTQFGMLEAEEYGITSKNVDEMLKSDNPAIKRLLGVTPGMGKALGLDEKWLYNVIKQVGNYSESFDRNLGKDSTLKIDRGLNKLWKDGGLQYAPPIR